MLARREAHAGEVAVDLAHRIAPPPVHTRWRWAPVAGLKRAAPVPTSNCWISPSATLSLRDWETVRNEMVGISSQDDWKTEWAVGWDPLSCRIRTIHRRRGVTFIPLSRSSCVNSMGVFTVAP
jgi:hypothetical protein